MSQCGSRISYHSSVYPQENLSFDHVSQSVNTHKMSICTTPTIKERNNNNLLLFNKTKIKWSKIHNPKKKIKTKKEEGKSTLGKCRNPCKKSLTKCIMSAWDYEPHMSNGKF